MFNIFQLLYIILKMDELKEITKVSEVLYLIQPAVSIQLKLKISLKSHQIKLVGR